MRRMVILAVEMSKLIADPKIIETKGAGYGG